MRPWAGRSWASSLRHRRRRRAPSRGESSLHLARGSSICVWTGHRAQGEIPERPNGPDCKSGGNTFGGSNPPLPTKAPGSRAVPFRPSPSEASDPKLFTLGSARVRVHPRVEPSAALRGLRAAPCGRSSMVELQPSKLIAWVRFPSPAPALAQLPHPRRQRSGRGSELARSRSRSRAPRCCSSVVEHFLGKEEVLGSIPSSSSSLACGDRAHP